MSLSIGCVGLGQALAGDRDLLLAGVDGGLAHDRLVGRASTSSHTSLLTTNTSGSAT